MSIVRSVEEMKKAYKENSVFKEFVDGFAQARRKTPEQALEDAIVFEVYKKYVEK